MSRFRLGDWTVDASDGTLVSQSAATRLEPKVMAVLLLLVERRGTVVPQPELLRAVWRDTHVEPGALARTISLLRGALGDDAHRPRYIQTVPKRGYRLIAAVEELAAIAPRPARPAWARSAALLAAAVSIVLLSTHRQQPSQSAAPIPGRPHFTNQTRVGNENAFAYYTRAVVLDPDSAEAHAGLATAYAFRANYLPDRDRWVRLAIASASRAAALDPECPEAARALGTAYVQAGRLKLAALHYRRSLALCPEDDATRTNLGRVLMSGGRVADALALYERHVASAPDSVAGYAHLAGGLVVAGYPREAAETARAALVLEPYALEPQLLLTRSELLAGRYDDAHERLERLLEVHPECTQCVVQLGLIDQLRGRHAAAAARYGAARAMSPPFPGASLRLAQLQVMAGRRGEAEALLDEVEAAAHALLDGGSEASYPRWQLAAAASVRGDGAAALDWYRMAVASGRRDATWDGWDPLLATLRAEPAFDALQRPFGIEHAAARSIAGRLASTLAVVDSGVKRLLSLPIEATDPPGWPSPR